MSQSAPSIPDSKSPGSRLRIDSDREIVLDGPCTIEVNRADGEPMDVEDTHKDLTDYFSPESLDGKLTVQQNDKYHCEVSFNAKHHVIHPPSRINGVLYNMCKYKAKDALPRSLDHIVEAVQYEVRMANRQTESIQAELYKRMDFIIDHCLSTKTRAELDAKLRQAILNKELK
jgi:hypothetical protein